MLSRRDLLLKLTDGTALVPLIGTAMGKPSLRDTAQNASVSNCARPLDGPYAYHFPNVVVYTHEGQRALFYDDLLRRKMVMINCMSIKNERVSAVSRNLMKVQRLLGDSIGRDLFMYSITVDPEHDTPQALKAFAEAHRARPGWTFLTGEPRLISILRSRLFVAGNDHYHHSEGGLVEDCSLALIRYGNEAVGLWGSVPAKTNPASIVMRLSWIKSVPAEAPALRRGGPSSWSIERPFSRGLK
jgi:protein SCO1/2